MHSFSSGLFHWVFATKRREPLHYLSSLTGLRTVRGTSIPALKRWAILGSERIDAPSQINPFAMAARESERGV